MCASVLRSTTKGAGLRDGDGDDSVEFDYGFIFGGEGGSRVHRWCTAGTLFSRPRVERRWEERRGEETKGDSLYLSAMRRIRMRLRGKEARTRCYGMRGRYCRSPPCAVDLEEAL